MNAIEFKKLINEGIFLDNKYTKCYCRIIQRSINTGNKRIKNETQRHHIIPESFFKDRNRPGPPGWVEGNPDDRFNLVNLSIREHRLCHLLLIKMVDSRGYFKMIFAAKWILDSSSVKHGLSKGRLYEKLIKVAVGKISISASSRKRPPMSEATKRKIGDANRGKVLSDDHKIKIQAANTGRVPHNKGKSPSESTREKQSLAAKSTRSDAWKKSASISRTGKKLNRKNNKLVPMSDETKSKISASLTGKKRAPFTEETKEKMKAAWIARKLKSTK